MAKSILFSVHRFVPLSSEYINFRFGHKANKFFFRLDKLIAGMCMGEIVRLVLEKLTNAKVCVYSGG